MSKHKDKKPKEEVNEEVKTPSAEVSETEAEVETEEVETQEPETEEKPSAGFILLATSGFIAQAQGLLSIIEVDSDHHNKAVIDIGISDAVKATSEALKHLAFVEKALKEKKK